MKKNKVPVLVDPEFRKLLKIESKAHGMTIQNFTERLVNKGNDLEELAEGWNKKYKNVKKRGFDFP